MSSREGPWRLVVIDLDGTILRGSILRALGRQFGFPSHAAELEELYRSGEADNTFVTAEATRRFAGHSLSDASFALQSIPQVNDTREVCAALAEAGVRTALATVSFGFAAGYFADQFGADFSFGAEVGLDDSGLFTGRVTRHVEAVDKLRFTDGLLSDLGFERRDAVAIGDGRSDLSLFEELGFCVAFNASPEVRSIADVVVDGASMWDAVRSVPGLLGR